MPSHIKISTQQDKEQCLTVNIHGRLDANSVSEVWDRAQESVNSCSSRSLVLDLGKVDYLDSAGAVLISTLEKGWKQNNNGPVSILGLKPAFEKFVALSRGIKESSLNQESSEDTLSFVETRGKDFSTRLAKMARFVSHIGEITWALIRALMNPASIRWKDALLAAERAGVNALPIVALISFIVGLVMAFQSAMPMKMFGAEIYVANLIGIAMVRELGPLMTAIILAGRSGSSFAAEIGTMKINEEIDALSTMGINPIQFLMVPRMLAAIFITPLLTIFADLVGIIGGSLVLISMGYPAITYYKQVISFVTWIDFTGGIVKCFVFGVLISAAGCIKGFETTSGPGAVGLSTTSAVVSGIILVAVFDGIFSVLYYCLGI